MINFHKFQPSLNTLPSIQQTFHFYVIIMLYTCSHAYSHILTIYIVSFIGIKLLYA